MKNLPKKIYLQIGEPECDDFDEIELNNEVTWCADRINPNDVEYCLNDKKRKVKGRDKKNINLKNIN